MLIDFSYILNKYKCDIKGILHIGAHECEELETYEKYISRNKILWVEAIPEKVKLNKSKYDNLLIEEAVVSDKVEEVIFNVSNNGQSSSVLNFEQHQMFYPHIYYVKKFKTTSQLLSNIVNKYDIHFNFLNLDIQGLELKALIGLGNYLQNVDYIYTEVNKDYLYENCSLIQDLDPYLSTFNFLRVETKWYNEDNWGDAFYIKRKK